MNTRVLPLQISAVAILVVLASGYAVHNVSDDDSPYEPDEALATFEIEDGFRLDLVAAEPLIADPVDMAVDEHGRIYVVEMPGYPLDTGGSGRVKLLTDGDGDGQPDESTVFADGLTLPTGVMRWKNGILVTDAPDVLYLEDTDDDGQADVTKSVLTGFALSNPQHNFNNPVYGLDNWIYLANEGTIWWTEAYAEQFGDRGGEVHFPERPDDPRLGRNANDRNVRFRPDTYALETMSGWSQFGHTFDAWGHHFLVSNADHHFHEVIAARYLQRVPDVPIRQATHNTPDHGDAATVYPITLDPEHQLLTDRGVFTSASGITYNLGGLFPESYDNVTFVAESVHNLVHADRVTADGATFMASRVQEGSEFLASRDAWFRPVNLYIGPDGALYVIDYYRQIVEHPEWMSEEAIQSGDLYNGSDRGRIYRIVPEDAGPMAWVNSLRLGEASDEALVDALERPNVWWRRTAQRLLVDRQPATAVDPLAELVHESPSPEARVHALWTLDGLGHLTSELIEHALRDEAPGVRENAILLAELHLANAPELTNALLSMQDDPDARVRFQLLCTLGALDTERAQNVRQQLLLEDIEDEWMQAAALTATTGQEMRLFEQAVAQLTDRETEGLRTYFQRIGTMIGARQQSSDVERVLRRLVGPSASGAPWWRAATLVGLAEGLRDRDSEADLADERAMVLNAFFEGDTAMRQASLDLLGVIDLPTGAARHAAMQRAVDVVTNHDADADFRADAIRLLVLDDPESHINVLKQTIDSTEPATVQKAALHVMRQVGGADIGVFLLDRWATMTPEVRSAAVDVFMTHEERVRLLLDAVEAEQVQVATIGWHRRVVLMRDWSSEIRDRARALLSERPGQREEVIAQYQAVLEMQGDASRGQRVFARVCAPCHQMGGAVGTSFGPDLGTVQHWPRQDLIASILNPNASIADGYEQWTIQRTNGDRLTGVIAAETPTSVTLQMQGGVEYTIPRTDIQSVQAVPTSAMPAGLEAQVSEQEMADLLAFIKQ